MHRSWHTEILLAALLVIALGAYTECFAQPADVPRGEMPAREPSIPMDLSEEDPGFDDYNYRGDYRLRDRWWIAERRQGEPVGPTTNTPVAEAESEVYGDLSLVRPPQYEWEESLSDIQPVPDFGAAFRWQGPTDRPNYILPPVPYLPEAYPEAYGRGEIDLYRDGRFYDVTGEYGDEGPYPDQSYYDYYDYRNYYEVGGYSRDDEPGVGIEPR